MKESVESKTCYFAFRVYGIKKLPRKDKDVKYFKAGKNWK